MPYESQALVTTTIALDRVLYKKLKHLAVERGMPMRELIQEAVAALLKTKKKVRP